MRPAKTQISWSVFSVCMKKDWILTKDHKATHKAHSEDWKLVSSIVYSSTTRFVQMMTLGWPWLILRQGQIWSLMLLYGKKGKKMAFSETIVVYIKIGRFSQLNEQVKLYEYQRSMSFTDLRPRSLRFNIQLLLLRNRKADWSQISYGAFIGCGEWKFVQMFQVT